MTVGVLRILKYGDRDKLMALAELSGRDDGFDDPALRLEALKRLVRLFEQQTKEQGAKEEVRAHQSRGEN